MGVYRGETFFVVLLSTLALTLGCGGGGGGGDGASDAGGTGADAGGSASQHAANVAELMALLPADTRGVLAVDLQGLLSGGSAGPVAALLEGDGDPALAAPFAAIGDLAGGLDLAESVASALLVQTSEPADGYLLLLELREGHSGGEGGGGATQLPGGVLVFGTSAAVQKVIDAADGAASVESSALAPFLGALEGDGACSFVYGLPALYDDSIAPGRSLRGARVVSGAFEFDDGDVSGHVSFHTPNAAQFVADYNELDKHSAGGDAPRSEPLALGDALFGELAQVVVPVSSTLVQPSEEELFRSRDTAKKLFIGMAAHDYAEEVADPGNRAWLDLVVRSEDDGGTPPSPGSVFIRWEFRDQAAIDAFEANELPAGFSLAPCQFFESDDEAGEYFLALNLYNSGGGSIVNGARAEWDVFVEPPAGADPDAGARPRFMVIDALAQAVSADPVHLMTPAEPLAHELVDGRVVTSVSRFEEGQEVPVFASSFPRPDPASAPVARFTREMAIGNDYIYWGHGVYDRVLYNATTFNHDAYFADAALVEWSDDSHWAQYLKPDIKDVVYYVNTLEYVASPMANLRSELLDITPEWREELLGFKTNGHQRAMMRKAVEGLFRGVSDALTSLHVDNVTPATYFSFAITDSDGLAGALSLPAGYSLARTPILDGDSADYYLTLGLYEVRGALEGARAEWSVYVDDGSGRVRQMVVHLQTEDAALDPVRLLNPPSEVQHELADGAVRTRLASSRVEFEASFDTAGAADVPLALDWIEAGDHVCYLNGVCDKRYYDAETLDVPVRRPVTVAVETIQTPWDSFIDTTPRLVFYRGNAQELAVKAWHNLKVVVPELPFEGLADRTHTVSGAGTMAGRTTNVVDSTYTYTGDALLDGQQLSFAIDQQIENLLGVAHIITTGSFDVATGIGTQTVLDCLGPGLMCSGVVEGASAYYTAQNLDASDPAAISWEVNVVVDLGGSFGLADSASTFRAIRAE